MRSPRRLAPTSLATAALVAVLAGPATALVPIYPGVTSDNVTFIGNFPDSVAISAEFAWTGDYFYTSSLDSVSVFSYVIDGEDITVSLESTLPMVNFENESMTYGERRDASGAVTDRFVIVAEDLVFLAPTDPDDGHVGGDNIIIVDVTDPAAPFVRSTAETTSSTHTVQCLSRSSCDYAYTAGTAGEFSIIDMRDLDAPVEVAVTGPSANEDGTRARSPAAGPNSVFSSGAGHYWDIDDRGVAWHTGSGGATAFDTTVPTAPVILGATDGTGTETPYNDFIIHNSARPNGIAFDPGREDGNDPDMAKGNVLLITEEDYANDGDEVECDLTGEFSTWHITELTNAEYLAGAVEDPFTPNQGAITHLDSFHPVRDGEASPIAPPADTFCSAHWFDYHETGIVAQGYYAAGLYFLDVRDPGVITTYGWATARPSEVWDAYWFPLRDADGVDTGGSTSFVMTADNVRGIDVFHVALPETIIEPLLPGTAAGGGASGSGSADQDTEVAGDGLAATGGGLGLLAVGVVGLASALRRRRRD